MEGPVHLKSVLALALMLASVDLAAGDCRVKITPLGGNCRNSIFCQGEDSVCDQDSGKCMTPLGGNCQDPRFCQGEDSVCDEDSGKCMTPLGGKCQDPRFCQGEYSVCDEDSGKCTSKCNVSEAPELPNAHLSKWTMTSTSLEGDATCDADYMSPMDESSLVVCQLETGMWTTQMSCQQVVWRNNTVKTGIAEKYLLPRTPQAGWAVCLSATPTKASKFEVHLVTTDGETPFALAPVWSGRLTIMNYYVNDSWGPEMYLRDEITPFPFRVGDEFNMTIRANSSDTFNVYVQGAIYGSRTVPMSVSDITKIIFIKDVQVRYLNVWC